MDSTLETVDTPAAWKGPALDWRRECLYALSAAEVDEIDAALRHLRSLGDLDLPEITPATFPLPTVGRMLAELRHDLRFGRGFRLLRGLPRERYDADDLARIYFGLGVHIGTPVTQSRQGEFLGHVINISDIDASVRGYQYGGGQRMHTDSCDIVGLLCLRAAKSGGYSRIVSAVAIHNELVRTRPELARLHYEGFTYRRNALDAQLGDGVVVRERPVVTYARSSGEFSNYCLTNYAFMAHDAGDAQLSALQREAFEEVQRLGSSPEFYLDMSIGEGDVQFLNNRLLLHSRTDYEDHQATTRRRHMMRLWLRLADWPPMPANQRSHTEEDHRRWRLQREPRMELPSRFFAGLETRRQRAAAMD